MGFPLKRESKKKPNFIDFLLFFKKKKQLFNEFWDKK